MDVTAISQLIGTVGFPITMCIALFWKINKQDEQNQEQNRQMSEAVNNNTLVVTRLLERMDLNE